MDKGCGVGRPFLPDNPADCLLTQKRPLMLTNTVMPTAHRREKTGRNVSTYNKTKPLQRFQH